jgi:hypothetical protein
MRRKTLLFVLMLFTLVAGAGALWAQETQPAQAAAQEPKKRDITVGLIAASAALVL